MAGGTAAELPSATDAEWLAIADVDREPGRAHGRIRLAAQADQRLAERAAPALLSTTDEVSWTDGDVLARRVERLGVIVLRERPLTRPDRAAVRDALITGLTRTALASCAGAPMPTRLRQRLAFLHGTIGDRGPPSTMTRCWPTWTRGWNPNCRRATKRADLAAIPTQQALSRLLPWPQADPIRRTGARPAPGALRRPPQDRLLDQRTRTTGPGTGSLRLDRHPDDRRRPNPGRPATPLARGATGRGDQ